MKKKRRKKGFTLIELLLVIILISILAAIIVPRFAGRSEKAKIAAAEADINSSLSVALDLYELDNSIYPTTEQGLRALMKEPDIPPLPEDWQGPYIRGKKDFRDPWDNQYHYISPGVHNPKSFDLYSTGPDGIEGNSDDVTNWTVEGE
jgi:general secretion pathway protein G